LAAWTAVLPAADRAALEERSRMAELAMDRGSNVEAEKLLTGLLAEVRAPEHSKLLLLTLENMCAVTVDLRAYRRAERYCKEGLDLTEARLGPDHLELAGWLHNLATAYIEQGRYGKAEALCRRALAIKRAATGAKETFLGSTLHHMGYIRFAQGRYDEAEAYFEQALELSREPARRANALNSLSGVLYRRGRDAEALRLGEEALALTEEALGPNHWRLAPALLDLATGYLERGQRQQAQAYVTRGRQIAEAQLGPTHPITGLAIQLQARLWKKTDRKAEAKELERQAKAIFEADQQQRRAFDGLVDISDFRPRR
jgi:tetratricopeptide (TPR) repeat protein